MKTTLNKIREKEPCADGWEKLLKHLGKTSSDDEELSILTILNSNGLDDAVWCLRAVDGCDKDIRMYAVWCARQVQHLMTDERSLSALDVVERFANGKATSNELKVAGDAAWDAAWDAGWDATKAAASTAACAAAWDATRTAACVAAWDATRAATRAAGWDAGDAGDAQEKQLRSICK